ncbi:MAG: 4-amino-4-deoxychorismate lyase, partial [Pseudomonadota bacterium]
MSDPVRFGRAAENRRAQSGVDAAAAHPAAMEEPANSNAARRGKKKRADRNQFVVFFNFLFSLLVFTLAAMGVALYFGKTQFEAQGPHSVGTTYMVREGANVAQVGNDLRRNGLISNSRIFEYG